MPNRKIVAREHGVIVLPWAVHGDFKSQIIELHNEEFQFIEQIVTRISNGEFDNTSSLKQWKIREMVVKGSGTSVRRLVDKFIEDKLGATCPDYVPQRDVMIDRLTNALYRYLHLEVVSGERPTKHAFEQIIGTRLLTQDAVAVPVNDHTMISFPTGRSTVVWEVEEGADAPIYAHRTLVGVMFFEMLHRIHWAAGTGGVIIGRDQEAPGRKPYVKFAFGPLGQEEFNAGFFQFR